LGFGSNTFEPGDLDPSFFPFIEHLKSLEGQIIYVATKGRKEFDGEVIKHHFKLIEFPQDMILPASNISPEKLCSALDFEFIPQSKLAERWGLELHEGGPDAEGDSGNFLCSS